MLHGKACSTGTLKLSETQGPEEMCLSLEHQNPSEKPLKKWGILIALQFRYTFFRPSTKRLRARKIGLHYKLGTSGDVPCASEDMACGY